LDGLFFDAGTDTPFITTYYQIGLLVSSLALRQVPFSLLLAAWIVSSFMLERALPLPLLPEWTVPGWMVSSLMMKRTHHVLLLPDWSGTSFLTTTGMDGVFFPAGTGDPFVTATGVDSAGLDEVFFDAETDTPFITTTGVEFLVSSLTLERVLLYLLLVTGMDDVFFDDGASKQ